MDISKIYSNENIFWTTLPTSDNFLFCRLHQSGSTWPKSMKSVNNGEMLQECLLGFLWKQDKGRQCEFEICYCGPCVVLYSYLLV